MLNDLQVIAELLARNELGHQPKALLIAPTTSLVATCGFTKDPAFQIQCNEEIHVVHGTDDLAFCPNQDRWHGDNVHQVPDNHVFFRSSSQRLLVELLTSLLND